MIASIKGIVEDKAIDRLIVDVSGVGYEVFVTDSTASELVLGKSVKLYIREQIREDTYDLFGFVSKDEKELFEKLLSVKNVGPRVALAVLNLGSHSKLRQAIAGGDAKFLQSAKGVGRRAAEQIIVELRDKVGLSSSMQAEAIATRSGGGESDEAVEALMSLGYSIYDAKTALADVDPKLSTEERIKQALKGH